MADVNLRDLMDERDLRYESEIASAKAAAIELEKRHEQRFTAQEKALAVALDAQKRHDDWSNNVLEMVRGLISTFMEKAVTKESYEQRHKDLERQIADISKNTLTFESTIRGKEKIGGGIFDLAKIVLAALMGAALTMLLRK